MGEQGLVQRLAAFVGERGHARRADRGGTQLGGVEGRRFRGRDFPHSAIILGPTPLKSSGLTLDVPDLRAGLAYVIADEG